VLGGNGSAGEELRDEDEEGSSIVKERGVWARGSVQGSVEAREAATGSLNKAGEGREGKEVAQGQNSFSGNSFSYW
jgi:hypothetical protein